MILEKRNDNGAVNTKTTTIGIKLSIKLKLKSKLAITKVIIERPTVSE